MSAKYGQNMILVTSYWEEDKTFRLIPVTPDCPYTEVIYDPSTTLLVLIGKVQKDKFQMLPKLDDDGVPMKIKHGKQKPNGKDYKEARTTVSVLQEYYVVEKDEQESFIKSFAINHETYDYHKYLRDMGTEAEKVMIPEQPPITDKHGNPVEGTKLDIVE